MTESTVQKIFRIGQIVPSSNTTMETEIPAMLTLRQQVRPERFTFHSSRMRMKKVNRSGRTCWRASSIAGISVSIVVLELGTIWPIRKVFCTGRSVVSGFKA